MQTGWFQDFKNNWYYLEPATGAMRTGWFLAPDGKWYYLDAADGYCLMDTVTPDGCRVDRSGAWIS